MGAVVTLVLSLLSKIPGQIGDYYSKKLEIEQQKLVYEHKLQLAREKLIATTAKADADRAEQSLKSTGSYFKYCVFWMLSSPFISCLIGYPEYAEMVFKNLNALPEWYLLIYTAIIGVIWGIPVPGSVMGNIWEGIKDSRKNKREYQLKIYNAKAAYDILRNEVFTQGMTQKQVDAVKKALEKYTADNDDRTVDNT